MEKPGVQVFGQNELYYHLTAGGEHYNCLISIGNPYDPDISIDTRMPEEFKQYFKRILRLEFHDADISTDGKKIPEIEDVHKIIDFFKQTQYLTNGYTIHCRQGVSRSTAVALGILYMIYMRESVAKNELLKIRPGALPLQRILKFFDVIFGSNLAKAGAEISSMYFDKLKKEMKDMEDSIKKEMKIKPHGLLARAIQIRKELNIS